MFKCLREKGLSDSKLAATQLFHLYRSIFKFENGEPFKTPEDASLHLKLILYLLDELRNDAGPARVFMADFVLALHKEICDSKRSKIDSKLSSDQYIVL